MAQIAADRGQARNGVEPVTWISLILATGVAELARVVSSGVVFLAASAASLIDRHVILPSLIGMGPMSLASVAATAAAATVGSGALLGVLNLTTRRPIRNHRVAGTVLALLSLSMPATIPGPSPAMRLTMAAMHVAVWAASVGVLATLARWLVRAAG